MPTPKRRVNGGPRTHSQAKPPTAAESTAIAFVLVPADTELVDERPDDVREAVRRACGSARLDDVEISIDGEQVRVSAMNPTAYTPSRVLHTVWTESEIDWGTIPKPREVGRLAWSRGDVIDTETDQSRLSKLFG